MSRKKWGAKLKILIDMVQKEYELTEQVIKDEIIRKIRLIPLFLLHF